MEVNAGTIAEAQTRQIAKEFKTSRPKPRNKAMGFRDEWKDEREMRQRQRREWLAKRKAT